MQDIFLKIEDYIETLYQRQNFECKEDQKNLFSKADYYRILKPVIVAMDQNPTANIQTLREILRKQSGIEKKLHDFVFWKEETSGIVLGGSTPNYEETYVIGNKKEVDYDAPFIYKTEKMKDDTLFDLASVSKLFMGISILKLVEQGIIYLDDEIVKYAPQFTNLSKVRIMDALGFSIPFKTKVRIDSATSKEEAEKILFEVVIDTESDNKDNHLPYTDIGAMILRYVVEGATKLSMKSFLEQEVFSKMGLTNVFVNVPKDKLDLVACTNYDTIVESNGTFITNTQNTKGIVYDPKAKVMGHQEGIFSGHAGLFSNCSDMIKLGNILINGDYLKKNTIIEMAKNRSGRVFAIDATGAPKYTQYLGYMCYSKCPRQEDSEVYHALSGISFAASGWTGCQLTVDPFNHITTFLGGNKAHNRITQVAQTQRHLIQTDKYGKRFIILPNGQMKIVSQNYAWDKDSAVLHPFLELMLQYKMLEDFLNLPEKEKKKRKMIRVK